MTLAGAVVGLIIFASASFFFALSETALFSLRKWQVSQLRGAEALQRLLSQQQDVLATIVLGNTFSNAALAALALWVGNEHQTNPLLVFVCLVVGLLLAVEVAPKALAVRSPEDWAVRVTPVLEGLVKFSRPVRRVGQGIANLLVHRFLALKVKPMHGVSEEEYKELLESAYQQGALRASEKEIILEIVNLDQRTASDVMKPRSQMAAIPDDLSTEEMIAAAKKFKHTRLPMYDETPDTIVGILNVRSFLLDPKQDISEVIEFPSFVPESMNLMQLLKSLQRQRRGMAMVLDEFGGTAGLVTGEDILEAMVGDIRDEGEEEHIAIEKLGPGKWRVRGTVKLDELERDLPHLGDVTHVDTFGGLLASQCGSIPAPGESAYYKNLKLTAIASDDRRVREVEVEVLKGAHG